VEGLSGVTSIAAGWNHCLAVTEHGEVWAWGSNEYGQLGDGSVGSLRTVPAPVWGLADVRVVAAGKQHSLAVTGDGELWSWGQNRVGELGVGTMREELSTLPVPVAGLHHVVGIATQGTYNLAVEAPTVGRLAPPTFVP